VRLNPQESGLELILETQSDNKRPEVFTVSRGNDWVADIVNTQLSLREGDSFRQENPMPGITSVLVSQLDANNVRVTVSGASSPPTGQILQNEGQGITLGISTESKTQAAAPSPVSPSPTAPVSAATPALPVPQAATPLSQRSNSPTILAQTPTPEPVAQQQAPASPTPVVPTVIPQPIVPAPTPDVLVPNPRITIDGVPAPATGAVQPVAPAPPFLPRAIAPPVGDIAISNINAAASSIDLGTGVRVPRLVLREAPVREVLALLARSAGLNLAFTGEGGARPGGGQGAAPAGAQQTISLDLEDEPVQDVFNYVLRISGLQANRVGRTIFVGSQLPDAARNIVARTLRLNQVAADIAVGFLIAQGAEQQQIVNQTTLTVVGEGAAAQRIENTTTTVQRITAQTQGQGQGQGVQGPTGPLMLRGLLVTPDDRLNLVTLVGEPRQVEIASALLTQLDLRRRQVAVNVKIIDVNLLGTDAFNSSFSFGIGDSFFVNDGGAASFNYGGLNPPNQLQVSGSPVSPPLIGNPFGGANIFRDPNNFIAVPETAPGTTITDARTGSVFRTPRGAGSFNSPFVRLTDPLQPGFTNITPATNDLIAIDRNGNITVTPGTDGTVTFALPTLFQYPTRFLSALQAQITSGNAKILTDPTLVVQEGETATVNLTQEVVGNISSETESTNNLTTRTVTAQIREAGLILEIAVNRIDDNGFISLAVNPRVTAIGARQNLSVGDDTNQIALLNVRQLRSGQIRLRDGQTLILSGIIQESDRTEVSKVPILGDIPLLGALFRSTNRSNQRQEVIVLLTPQIIDDSAGSSFGYNYTPGRESRQILQREGISP
jgi:type IV pilus assembly protein PilQ